MRCSARLPWHTFSFTGNFDARAPIGPATQKQVQITTAGGRNSALPDVGSEYGRLADACR